MNQTDAKKWALHCLAVRLVQIVDASGADKQTHDAQDGSHECPDEDAALATPVTAETATVYLDPTFKSYLMAIGRLLKQALLHKKGEHFILIG